MGQHADAQVMGADAPSGPGQLEQPADTVLGWYTSAEGRRQVRAVTTPEDGLSVIDEGADGALLVEPRLDGMAEARAVAADYLSIASERGEPQTRHPWLADSGSRKRGES